MLPDNILKVIGEPGKNTVLILDAIFRAKKRKSLTVVYDDDIREYCVKFPDKVKISPAAAVSETQVLKWYGVVKITKKGKQLVISKDKMFDRVAKLSKKKPKKVKPGRRGAGAPKAKSFESIFDSFLIKPKTKNQKPKTLSKGKRGKNDKRKLHLLQNSKKRNTKQKNSRGRKVSRVSGHKSNSKRPRTRNTKKPLRNISGNARKRSKRTVRPKPKARKKPKRKTKR
ncbi:MAG: hypothetical protein QF475_03050 [Candidatus Undinarchaeales archaeon]|jgi:hypothetical protein|nr:hypothetical protein [Candidatus Undinarchaeales archaeon]